jgi:hypothetical protein
MTNDRKTSGVYTLDLRFKMLAWSVRSLITLGVAFMIVTFFGVPGWVLPLAVGYILGSLGLTVWTWQRGQKTLEDHLTRDEEA